MANYVTRAPALSFKQLQRLRKEAIRNKYPKAQECHPTAAHFEPQKLEANLFCRLLASRSKMDAVTRYIMPATLLHKVSVVGNYFSAVSTTHTRLRGPRVWVSGTALAPLPPNVLSQLRKDRREFKEIVCSPHFAEDAKEVVVQDIKAALKSYNLELHEKHTHGIVICQCSPDFRGVKITQGCVLLGTQRLPESLQIPTEICNTSNGMKLAGFLYKYIAFF